MDDTEELTFGFKVSRTLLQELMAINDGLEHDFCNTLLQLVDVNTIKTWVAFHSVSFGLRDDPKQWCKYGDHGRGVALGLAPDFFRLPIEDPNNPKPEETISCAKVTYGEKSARARHSTVIEAALALLNRPEMAGLMIFDKGTLFQNLAARMYPEILWNCVTTKEAKWSHQNEWRLLALNILRQPTFKVVAAANPRLEIDQPRLKANISEVMIGKNAQAGAKTRIRKFLIDCDLPKVKVTTQA